MNSLSLFELMDHHLGFLVNISTVYHPMNVLLTVQAQPLHKNSDCVLHRLEIWPYCTWGIRRINQSRVNLSSFISFTCPCARVAAEKKKNGAAQTLDNLSWLLWAHPCSESNGNQHCSPYLSCAAHCPLWCTTNWDGDCDLAARSSLCPEAYTFVHSFIYWFIWIALLLWTLDTFLFSFCLATTQSGVIFLPSGSGAFCDSFPGLWLRVKIIITICYAKESLS